MPLVLPVETPVRVFLPLVGSVRKKSGNAAAGNDDEFDDDAGSDEETDGDSEFDYDSAGKFDHDVDGDALAEEVAEEVTAGPATGLTAGGFWAQAVVVAAHRPGVR